jgi:hypothetical protein
LPKPAFTAIIICVDQAGIAPNVVAWQAGGRLVKRQQIPPHRRNSLGINHLSYGQTVSGRTERNACGWHFTATPPLWDEPEFFVGSCGKTYGLTS